MARDWDLLFQEIRNLGLRIKSYNTTTGDIHVVVPHLQEQQ